MSHIYISQPTIKTFLKTFLTLLILSPNYRVFSLRFLFDFLLSLLLYLISLLPLPLPNSNPNSNPPPLCPQQRLYDPNRLG